MNAELIAREAHISCFKKSPHMTNRDSSLTRHQHSPASLKKRFAREPMQRPIADKKTCSTEGWFTSGKKGMENISDTQKDRREAVLSVIQNNGKASIKDISTLIRGVSEKTIQRELFSVYRGRKGAETGRAPLEHLFACIGGRIC